MVNVVRALEKGIRGKTVLQVKRVFRIQQYDSVNIEFPGNRQGQIRSVRDKDLMKKSLKLNTEERTYFENVHTTLLGR